MRLILKKFVNQKARTIRRCTSLKKNKKIKTININQMNPVVGNNRILAIFFFKAESRDQLVICNK